MRQYSACWTRCPTTLMYGKTVLYPLEMATPNFKRQGALAPPHPALLRPVRQTSFASFGGVGEGDLTILHFLSFPSVFIGNLKTGSPTHAFGDDEGFIGPRTSPCWFNEKPAGDDKKKSAPSPCSLASRPPNIVGVLRRSGRGGFESVFKCSFSRREKVRMRGN